MEISVIHIPNLGTLTYFTDDDGQKWVKVTDVFRTIGFNGGSLLTNRPNWKQFIKRFRGELASNSPLGVNYIKADHLLEVLATEKRSASYLVNYLETHHADIFGTFTPAVKPKVTDAPPPPTIDDEPPPQMTIQQSKMWACHRLRKVISLLETICVELGRDCQQTLNFEEANNETQNPEPNH